MNNETALQRASFLAEPKIAAWKGSLEDAGCTIRGIRPLNLLYHGDGSLLFALLEADANDSDGQRLMPYIFIRGNACIIVPLLRNRDSGEERFLMVRQRRIASGRVCLEFPAGMLDRDIRDPAGVALRELQEETGLSLSRNALIPLCGSPLFSSPGATDEAVYYFGCIAETGAEKFRAFDGGVRGCEAEHERLQVVLKTRDDALRELQSLQALLGIHLFDRARQSLEAEKVTI